MDTSPTLTFQVHVGRVSRSLVVRDGLAPTRVALGRIPRVTRNLVQAYQFQRMIDCGQARDLADLAGMFRITRARVTQIMNYMLLAPDIQEETLFLPRVTPGHDHVGEHDVRRVLRSAVWKEQRAIWKSILAIPVPAVSRARISCGPPQEERERKPGGGR